MKKLRSNPDEAALFIERIKDKIRESNNLYLEDFDIKDIIKDFCELPKDLPKPIIKITEPAYIKMLELVNQSDVECSWHGLVHRVKEENTYIVYDVLVFPQINTATATSTDEDEFAEWQMKLIMDVTFPIENLRLHGHSHVNMNVFSSGVDDKYQKDLITKVEDGDYYIFFIMNKKMDLCIFLYDFDQQIMFETKDIDFQIGLDIDIRTWAKDELKEKARAPKVTTYNTGAYCRRRIEEDDYDYGYSYFSKAEPIFKGVKNGSK